MRLFIEQRHIEAARGQRGNPRRCPVANAVNEQLGFTNTRAVATPFEVSIRDTDEMNFFIIYQPSKEMVNFMARFDTGHNVQPCALDLKQRPLHYPT